MNRVENWHLAARISGWRPRDDNGDAIGISPYVPIPGFAEPKPDIPLEPNGDPGYLVTDQKVRRIQIGGGVSLYDNVLLKGEVFQDNYQHSVGGQSTDTEGFVAAINVKF